MQGILELGILVEGHIGVMSFALAKILTVLLNDFSYFKCLSKSLVPVVPIIYLYCKLLRDVMNIIH